MEITEKAGIVTQGIKSDLSTWKEFSQTKNHKEVIQSNIQLFSLCV